jgi:phosphatidylinositol alpha-1,6-mannosyltransferase
VPDQELAAYYAACDLFIMPNREIDGDIEGFGMVFLEAGAARKPVIGGRSGGTEDAIVHGITGLRVDGTDVEAIAFAVVSLLLDPARAKILGEAGRRRIEQEFTWEAVVEQTRGLCFDIQRENRK